MSNDHTGRQSNFIAIQADQGISAQGYQPTPLRTGYEQVIAHRVGPTYASTAAQKGKVTSLKDNVLSVTYEDGTTGQFDLSTHFGSGAGVVYPHERATTFKPGDTFQAGDILVYNQKFFDPDTFNPGKVVFKSGVLCRTAIMDDIDTLEDGSAISEAAARKLQTNITEVRNLQVRFDQLVHDLVQEGQHVDLDSILCTIEDPETASNPLFDEASLDTLRRLSQMTPRAKVVGTVQRIEVFYHGDYDDLSENLQQLASWGDQRRKARAEALGKPVFTGQVDTSFRIRGKALDPDTLAIRIYIDHAVGCATGDKATLCLNLKTVFSRVMTGVNRTASGDAIDVIFGNTSIEDRQVLSPKLMGTTNTLLRVLSKHVSAVYRGQANARRRD